MDLVLQAICKGPLINLTVLCVYQELTAEKSKVTSVETRLSSQLSKREQEMIALQARMQASYQDHVAQTQKLNAKVSCNFLNVQLRFVHLSMHFLRLLPPADVAANEKWRRNWMVLIQI